MPNLRSCRIHLKCPVACTEIWLQGLNELPEGRRSPDGDELFIPELPVMDEKEIRS